MQKPNSFWYWYRILRQHNRWSIWQAIRFARWLASPGKYRASVHVGNGYRVPVVR